MPLERCKINGVSGWRWGKHGACYTGKDGKKRALKQGYAISPEKFKEEMAKSEVASATEVEEVLSEMEREGPDTEHFDNEFYDAVYAYSSKKERDALPEEDFAWPEERKFPIRNAEDVESAARLIGRAPKEKQAAIKKRIIQIAKRKGLPIS